jgi:hypothetical protein
MEDSNVTIIIITINVHSLTIAIKIHRMNLKAGPE